MRVPQAVHWLRSSRREQSCGGGADQDERAVRKNPKHPDYSGLEFVLNHTTDVSGAASHRGVDAAQVYPFQDEGSLGSVALLAKSLRSSVEKVWTRMRS